MAEAKIPILSNRYFGQDLTGRERNTYLDIKAQLKALKIKNKRLNLQRKAAKYDLKKGYNKSSGEEIANLVAKTEFIKEAYRTGPCL